MKIIGLFTSLTFVLLVAGAAHRRTISRTPRQMLSKISFRWRMTARPRGPNPGTTSETRLRWLPAPVSRLRAYPYCSAKTTPRTTAAPPLARISPATCTKMTALAAPGTLIASSTVPSNSVPFGWTIAFPFSNIYVPDTFTYMLSSTFPNDFTDEIGCVGLYNVTDGPLVGSGVNTVWYNTSSGPPFSWVSNNSWAEADGADTNYFAATVYTVPEPGTVLLLCCAAGVGIAAILRRRRR